MWVVKIIESAIAVMLGRLEEAEGLASECVALGQKVDEINAGQHLAAVMYAVRYLQGRLTEIDDSFRSGAEQFADVPLYRAAIANLHIRLGRIDEAREEFENIAINDFSNLQRDSSLFGTVMHLADVAVALGDAHRAALLYDLFRPYGDYLFVFGLYTLCLGATAHWLGLLATTLERWDDAVEHFEVAIETNTRIGARPWLAISQHEYARMLMERNESGDKEKAKTLLTEATASYRELGMPTFLEGAEALLGKL
jgi:tetratricopeptide (TPR) repeat protein